MQRPDASAAALGGETHGAPTSAGGEDRGPARGVAALLFWAMLVSYAGLGALYAFMPSVGRELGVPDALVASTASISSLIWFLVAPMWSQASDRIGRKPIILVGCAGFAVSSALTALAIFIGLQAWVGPMTAFTAIVASRGVMGLFGFASQPASQAYIADHTRQEERTKALSLLTSAQGLGSILGPAIAPLMVLPIIGLAGPMFCYFVIGSATLLLAALLIPSDRRVAAPAPPRPLLERLGIRGGFWGDPQVGPFVWCSLWLGVASIVNAQVIGFMIIDQTGLPPLRAQVYTSYVLMGGAAVSVIAQSVLIPMFRLQANRLLWAGFAIALIGNLVLAFARGVWPAAVGFGLASLGYAFVRPGVAAGASLAAPDTRQGEVAGAVMAASIGGVVFAPGLALLIYQGWRDGPYLANAVGLAAALAFVRINPALRQAGQR